MVATVQVITVASIDENGYLRPVAMVKIKDEDGAMHLFEQRGHPAMLFNA